jgi:hypothetical protein
MITFVFHSHSNEVPEKMCGLSIKFYDLTDLRFGIQIQMLARFIISEDNEGRTVTDLFSAVE